MDIKSQQINLKNEKQLKNSKTTNQGSADFANELIEVQKEVTPVEKMPETENISKKENAEIISTNNIDLVRNNIISKRNKETLKDIDSKIEPQINKNPEVDLTLEIPAETNTKKDFSANLENLQNNIKELQHDLNTEALPDTEINLDKVDTNLLDTEVIQEETLKIKPTYAETPEEEILQTKDAEKEITVENITEKETVSKTESIPVKHQTVDNEKIIDKSIPDIMENINEAINKPEEENSVKNNQENNIEKIITDKKLEKEENTITKEIILDKTSDNAIEPVITFEEDINKDLEIDYVDKKIEHHSKEIENKQEKQNVEDNHLNKAIESLSTIMKELNQSDDKLDKSFKKEENKTDNNEVINNDFNIQENKDLLPQMTPNMNFSGDGQPFSSFMNNDDANKKQNSELKATAQDLAEEAAILSTMAENIAIANKNQIKQPEVKTVARQDGIKKVDTKTNITVETVVKYDSVIMNEADVEVFANLVENQEVNLKDLAPKAAEKSIEVSKTLADMLSKAMEKNQPVRIDFDNNISVIIRISRDGKITADFLPSSQVAEAYLKENLPLLRQKFDDNNIDYESLNQRERRDQSKENNRKKGRNNE